MTRCAQVGLGMIALCAAVSPFGGSIAHGNYTHGLDQSVILQILTSKQYLLFNQIFVKYVWIWTLLIVIPFATTISLKIQQHSSINFKKGKTVTKIDRLKPLQPIFRKNNIC